MADPFYSSWPWRKLRLVVLSENPICEYCNKVSSRIVHHKVRRSMGGAALDKSNLMALCSRCHRRLTNGEVKFPKVDK